MSDVIDVIRPCLSDKTRRVLQALGSLKDRASRDLSIRAFSQRQSDHLMNEEASNSQQPFPTRLPYLPPDPHPIQPARLLNQNFKRGPGLRCKPLASSFTPEASRQYLLFTVSEQAETGAYAIGFFPYKDNVFQKA